MYTAQTYLHERLYTDTASSRYETTSLLLEEHMYAATAHISYKGAGGQSGQKDKYTCSSYKSRY